MDMGVGHSRARHAQTVMPQAVPCVCLPMCAASQVFLKAPEQLASFFNLSGCALGAATSHDGMLPLFAGFLPGLWQLTLDALSAGVKLLTSATACAACSSSSQLPAQQQQQQQGHHTGPGVGSVLRALLDALPAAWQCHQALITQRCEQRQLYLDAADGDEEQLLLSPTSQPLGGTPRQGPAGTAMAVAAELHRQSGWLVQLLGLGRHLHAAAAAGTPGGCGCIKAAAGDSHLRLAWRACLDDVVKTTRSSLPKVKTTASGTLGTWLWLLSLCQLCVLSTAVLVGRCMACVRCCCSQQTCCSAVLLLRHAAGCQGRRH